MNSWTLLNSKNYLAIYAANNYCVDNGISLQFDVWFNCQLNLFPLHDYWQTSGNNEISWQFVTKIISMFLQS